MSAEVPVPCGHDLAHAPRQPVPVARAAYRARAAAAEIAPLPRAAKDDALLAIADALEVRSAEIVEANAEDIARAREAGTSETVIDRLTLTPERVRAIAADVRDVAALPDPSARSSAARPSPTASTCARSASPSASSASSTRPGRT